MITIMNFNSKSLQTGTTRLNDPSTCTCVNRPLKRVARGGCPNDMDAVAVLPDNWTPRHSGPILTNYLKQREQDHKKVLDEIADSAAAVNEDINKKVRALAENLMTYIQQNQRDIDCVVDKCDTGEGPLTEKSRDSALKTVHEIMTDRIACTKDFKIVACDLEKERADKLRILLQGQFQRLVAVGHRTPKDLMHEFDERIYDINQQILSNSKSYTELEADLRSLSDEGITRARVSLNQLCLGIEMQIRGRSALIWNKDKRVSRQRPHTSMVASSSHPENVLDHVGELNAIISPLVEAYRKAVLKIYSGFYNKLTKLEKGLSSYNDFSGPNEILKIDLLDLNQLLERQFKRLTNNFMKKTSGLSDMSQSDVLLIQKSLWSLGECLRETCSILNHAGHLWDAHVLRLALAQKLTIAAVEDLLTSNDSIEQANEISFNIALEQLRCSPDKDKLQQQFDVILVLLNKTGDMYLQHSEAELRRLEEFMNFLPVLANTLLAEFNVFLDKYPRNVYPLNVTGSTTSLPASGNPRISSCSQIAVQQPLPRAIFQTELQELALMNWRNGFLESLKSNVSTLPEELKHQAQVWIEERSGTLHMRYSLKMVSHTIRLERVKAAQEARLAEIRCHDLRLESHLNAIFELIDRLPEDASEFGSLDEPGLYPFSTEIERMKINVDNAIQPNPLDESSERFAEVKKMKMKSYGPRIAKHRQLFEESLDSTIMEYKWLIEHRIQEARISNVRYISHIKLFCEGGQYATLEATKTCAALGKAADSLELCASKTLDILSQRRTQLLALADHQILPMQRIIEECIKPTGKASARSAKSNTKIDKKKKKSNA